MSSKNSLPYPPRGARGRALGLGATAQAIVPGVYAWAVTVAPSAFARNAPGTSKGVAVLGVVFLVLAPVLESKRPATARVVSIWGLVATSLVVWVATPAAAGMPVRQDPVRILAGMLGWALFAFASIAPPLPRFEESGRAAHSRPLLARGDGGRVDAAILLGGTLLAAILQGVGWQAEEPARATLTRMVGVAAGLAILSACGSLVVLRHAPHRTLPARTRVQRAALPLVLFGLWAIAGAIYAQTLRR